MKPADLPPLGVGVVLHAEREYLELCRPIIADEADFFEVSPETLWRTDPSGELSFSPWANVIEAIQSGTGRPLVGHGLALSPGTAEGSEAEQRRLSRWVKQIEAHQDRFKFLWYTEHLGWVTAEGMAAVLPMPLPPTEESVRTVAARLSLLKKVIPLVGFENQVSYFSFDDPRTEAPFWARICQAADLWLLLDLHNAWTQCVNTGVAMEEYLAGLDLSRVIEIHLSGGSESEPGLLPGGRTMRVDTHDNPVPEPVWRAFEAIAPRCRNLRGVVVERMIGTLGGNDDVMDYREEVRRAKSIFARVASC